MLGGKPFFLWFAIILHPLITIVVSIKFNVSQLLVLENVNPKTIGVGPLLIEQLCTGNYP